jgi:hypothetical protein
MYKLRASQFLDWYFADGDDYIHIGARMAFLLKQLGTGIIKVEDLFLEQDELPTWKLDDYDGDEDYIGADEVELINDIT